MPDFPCASQSPVGCARLPREQRKYLAPSSSGPGRRPLKAVAPVQIRSGLLVKQQVKGLIAGIGGQAHDYCPRFVSDSCHDVAAEVAWAPRTVTILRSLAAMWRPARMGRRSLPFRLRLGVGFLGPSSFGGQFTLV